MRPVVAIYSTFLQRAFDQVMHDTCLMRAPVTFALDRGGIVGADGPTHHGLYDLVYLSALPGIVVMAPKDENELRHMLYTALTVAGPAALRYPRGNGIGIPLDPEFKKLEIGKGEILREGADIGILALGCMVYPCLEAATRLEAMGISATVINARFVKPLDAGLDLLPGGGKAIPGDGRGRHGSGRLWRAGRHPASGPKGSRQHFAHRGARPHHSPRRARPAARQVWPGR